MPKLSDLQILERQKQATLEQIGVVCKKGIRSSNARERATCKQELRMLNEKYNMLNEKIKQCKSL